MSTDPTPQQPPPQPTNVPLEYARPADGISCPRCGQFGAKAVGFTWWGGALGPRMFNHTKCPACRYTFNAKTGKPNTTAIILYTVGGFVIAIVALIVLKAM